MRHPHYLDAKDLLAQGQAVAMTDDHIIIARTCNVRPIRNGRLYDAVRLVAFATTGHSLYLPLGRLRALPFNAKPAAIAHEAKLWINELVASARATA